MSTARSYEVTIGLFLEYLFDPRYGWIEVCAERFGEAPQEVFHEGNSVLHTVEYEGDPRRRPLTYDEVQALFDAADARPAKIKGQGRKGALTALGGSRPATARSPHRRGSRTLREPLTGCLPTTRGRSDPGRHDLPA
ncbi:hypothetical protein ABZ408_40650 [Streptomyces tibetensis]|uniref:Uncharacterized protein n=1 Tax=Streptomyces tibetensis TaxID=2382123 RepID=A0ABW6N945_9ACTN